MDNQRADRKRPIWVYLISIYYFLSAGWVLVSFYMISTGAIPLDAAQNSYFENLTIFDYLSTIGICAINIAAAIALLLLRKIALYIFVFALVLNLILVAWHSMARGWVEAIGGAGLTGSLIGYGIAIAVCLYAWSLVKKGILK